MSICFLTRKKQNAINCWWTSREDCAVLQAAQVPSSRWHHTIYNDVTNAILRRPVFVPSKEISLLLVPVSDVDVMPSTVRSSVKTHFMTQPKDWTNKHRTPNSSLVSQCRYLPSNTNISVIYHHYFHFM